MRDGGHGVRRVFDGQTASLCEEQFHIAFADVLDVIGVP